MKLSPLPTLRALVLLACGVSSIPLIPGATHTWSGKGADGFWSTAANWENNTPPVAHESPTGLIFPAAALRHTSTNNLLDLKVSALLLDGTAYSLRGTGVGTNITLLNIPGGVKVVMKPKVADKLADLKKTVHDRVDALNR